jgi:hypothetical protein
MGMFRSSGELLFERTYDDPETILEEFRMAKATSDGAIIVAGNRGTWNQTDFWLLKLNSAGDTLWTRILSRPDGDFYNAVEPAQDGTYLFAGNTYQSWPSNSAVWVIKTNADGDIIWQQIYGSGLDVTCKDIGETASGDFVLAGSRALTVPYLVKISSSGDTLWTRIYPNELVSSSTAASVEILTDGSMIIGADYAPFGSSDPLQGIRLLKVDSNGVVLFDSLYQVNSNLHICRRAQTTADGGIIISSYVCWPLGPFGPCEDALVMRTDANGDLLWSQRFGADATGEVINAAVLTSNGNLLLGGTIEDLSSPTQNDFYLLSLAESGAAIQFTPSELDFDTVLIGQMSSLDLEISSVGTEPLEITGVEVPTGFRCDIGLPWTIPPGERFSIPVDYEPVEARLYQGILILSSNAANGPARINLRGVGYEAQSSGRDPSASMPGICVVHEPVPNPFNPETQIRVDLSQTSELEIGVFDILGRQVSTLAQGRFVAGSHAFTFSGKQVAAGLYFCHANVNGVVMIRRLLLIK